MRLRARLDTWLLTTIRIDCETATASLGMSSLVGYLHPCTARIGTVVFGFTIRKWRILTPIAKLQQIRSHHMESDYHVIILIRLRF